MCNPHSTRSVKSATGDRGRKLHVVSEKGIFTDLDKVAAGIGWSVPASVREMQGVLGIFVFYQRFIHDFARIALPLHALTQGTKPKKNSKKKFTQGSCVFHWGDQAFKTHVEHLTSAPVLAFADFRIPFELYTDASGDLGRFSTVLHQVQEGQERVVAYASQCLTKPERNYPAHKLEFLALQCAVAEKSHGYLFGHRFVAYTGNNPLTYMLSSAKLDDSGFRWVAKLRF